MQELYPCLRSGVKLRTSASGPGIVDVTGGNEYRLSAAAAAVFALCDGSKNIRGVADDLAEESLVSKLAPPAFRQPAKMALFC